MFPVSQLMFPVSGLTSVSALTHVPTRRNPFRTRTPQRRGLRCSLLRLAVLSGPHRAQQHTRHRVSHSLPQGPGYSGSRQSKRDICPSSARSPFSARSVLGSRSLPRLRILSRSARSTPPLRLLLPLRAPSQRSSY